MVVINFITRRRNAIQTGSGRLSWLFIRSHQITHELLVEDLYLVVAVAHQGGFFGLPVSRFLLFRVNLG